MTEEKCRCYECVAERLKGRYSPQEIVQLVNSGIISATVAAAILGFPERYSGICKGDTRYMTATEQDEHAKKLIADFKAADLQ